MTFQLSSKHAAKIIPFFSIIFSAKEIKIPPEELDSLCLLLGLYAAYVFVSLGNL